MTTAGFIGLGSQGAGMARRIIEQGVPTTLWARRVQSLEPFAGTAALGTGLHTKLLNNALNAAHFALAHDAFALGAGLGLDPDRLAEALRNGSGRSFSLEVFVGLRSFDAIADHVGPIMAKDIGLF